jgi:hypothetical protein
MNVVLIAIGCILMALGLVMLANRSGYLYMVAVLAFWIHGTVPR